MEKGFPPIYDKNSKILILGTFPSVKSRENKFYYGNPQNKFWSTLSKIFDEELPISIQDKINFLIKHNIALYDVIEQSNLQGSADENLKKSDNKLSNLTILLPPHTKINKILCNGKLSYNITLSTLKTNIPIIYLPSTSPANPKFNFKLWKNAIKNND